MFQMGIPEKMIKSLILRCKLEFLNYAYFGSQQDNLYIISESSNQEQSSSENTNPQKYPNMIFKLIISKQLEIAYFHKVNQMDQYMKELSQPSQLQSSQNQMEDIPLSSNQHKRDQYTQASDLRSIYVQKDRCPRGKCDCCLNRQTKIISVIFCIIFCVLVGINNFVFQTLQVNNETKLFGSLGENKSQSTRNQTEKVGDERLQLPKQNALKKQYSPRQTTLDSKTQKIILDEVQVNQKSIQLKPDKGKSTPNQANLEVKKTNMATQPKNPFKILGKAPDKSQSGKKQKSLNALQSPKQKKMKIYYKNNFAKTNAKRPVPVKQKKNRKQKYNILSKIPKNPYVAENYSMITPSDIRRASRWRVLASQYYDTNSKIGEEELNYYMTKYNIDQYQELPFCIVIPTLNNYANRRAEKNLKSVLMQNYSNFRVMIIDDGSTDGTPQYIEGFLKKQTILDQSRYKIQKNQQRKYALTNVLYAAKTFCHPQDIFIVLDGDDQLLGKQVLKLFNAVFQKQKIWFMYTNFMSSIGALGYSRPYPPFIMRDNTYRDYGFTVTHLRAYYTQLLLNIRDQDLRDENGNYFTAAGDMAIVMPCLEQAHERVKYVPQITYLYNMNTGLNVHSKRLDQQRRNNLKIRSKSRYLALDTLF